MQMTTKGNQEEFEVTRDGISNESIHQTLNRKLSAEKNRIDNKMSLLRSQREATTPSQSGAGSSPCDNPTSIVATDTSLIQEEPDDMAANLSEDFSAADTATPYKFENAGDPCQRSWWRRMIPLAIGLACLAAVGAGIFFFMDSNEIALASQASQSANYQGVVSSAELAEHGTPEDCWILIDGTVYDLTKYAPKHPGGERLITDLAGTDATREYLIEHHFSLLSTLPGTVIGTFDSSIDADEKNEEGSEDYYGDLAEESKDASGDIEEPTDEVPNEPTVEVENDHSLTAFISEMHYDNIAGDVDQLIEVAFSNELDMSGYKVEFYRGKTGLVYNTELLLHFAMGESVNGLTFASRKVKSFQNGMDGVALIDSDDNVVEFISYEGNFTAIEGYAAGLQSVDIGVYQSGQDPQGWTLQKTGTGCLGEQFQWGINAEGTVGDVNEGMEVTCYDGDGPDRAQWAVTLSPTAACFAEHINLEQLAEHAAPGEDCWCAIFGIVYDFTVFAFEHTGGEAEILPHCGTDTSAAYLDRHSRGLLKYVTQHIVGRIGEEQGIFQVPCEGRRRLEDPESGYWDEDWGTVEEFEEYLLESDEKTGRDTISSERL